MARELIDKESYKGVVAVTRGGLIPSLIIARALDPRVIDSIGVMPYDDRVQEEPAIVKDVDRDLVGDGEGWLIDAAFGFHSNGGRIGMHRDPRRGGGACRHRRRMEKAGHPPGNRKSQDGGHCGC